MSTQSDEPNVRIGQELIRSKLATVRQVRECLSHQRKLREQGKEAPLLGGILVARDIIAVEDLKEILSRLGLLTLFCPSCSQQLRVQGYDRENEYMCRRCASELVYASSRPQLMRSSSSASSPSGFGVTPDGEAMTVPLGASDDPLVGKVVGGCRISRRLGQGGMGTVYQAEQINLGRTVALKVLAEELAEDETFVRRFLLEARAAASLNHSNIIHINDAGQEDGVFFFTMEFVDGENLAQRLRTEKRIPWSEALVITEQVARALECAHQGDIIHRDIKPENIMLSGRGVVKVADLGLAKKTMNDQGSTTLTQAGSILGTPYYMAPEQARDFRSADRRSDLYSLGVTLYKMLTGRVPFDGSSPIEVMMKALEGKKKAVTQICPEVPTAVESLVDRVMAVNPDDRYPDASAVVRAIQSVRDELTVSS